VSLFGLRTASAKLRSAPTVNRNFTAVLSPPPAATIPISSESLVGFPSASRGIDGDHDPLQCRQHCLALWLAVHAVEA
jgi:hypothetical protein